MRAQAPLKTVLLTSFCGFAIGNSVGLGAFSGGAVRYSLYTAAGLSPGRIPRVIVFISIAFGVGLAAIAIGQNAGTLVSEGSDDLTESFSGMTVPFKHTRPMVGIAPWPPGTEAMVTRTAGRSFRALFLENARQ